MATGRILASSKKMSVNAMVTNEDYVDERSRQELKCEVFREDQQAGSASPGQFARSQRALQSFQQAAIPSTFAWSRDGLGIIQEIGRLCRSKQLVFRSASGKRT